MTKLMTLVLIISLQICVLVNAQDRESMPRADSARQKAFKVLSDEIIIRINKAEMVLLDLEGTPRAAKLNKVFQTEFDLLYKRLIELYRLNCMFQHSKDQKKYEKKQWNKKYSKVKKTWKTKRSKLVKDLFPKFKRSLLWEVGQSSKTDKKKHAKAEKKEDDTKNLIKQEKERIRKYKEKQQLLRKKREKEAQHKARLKREKERQEEKRKKDRQQENDKFEDRLYTGTGLTKNQRLVMGAWGENAKVQNFKISKAIVNFAKANFFTNKPVKFGPNTIYCQRQLRVKYSDTLSTQYPQYFYHKGEETQVRYRILWGKGGMTRSRYQQLTFNDDKKQSFIAYRISRLNK